jgi:DNA-binding response OmpR family regulator
MNARILLVEDDESIARVLRDNLTLEGFEVAYAYDCGGALLKARSFVPDLVVLDLMLPDGDGFGLFGALGQQGRIPIIVLTARGERGDKLRGLSLGADDYITKPFDLEELLARVRNLLRRARSAVALLRLGSVTIDFRTRTVTGGRTTHLTEQEFLILQYLAERQNRVVRRHELLSYVWGYPEAPLTRAVDQAVARLRKKLEPRPHNPKFIHSVHGEGYRLTPEPSA